MSKNVLIYARVSTSNQTTENQLADPALRAPMINALVFKNY